MKDKLSKAGIVSGNEYVPKAGKSAKREFDSTRHTQNGARKNADNEYECMRNTLSKARNEWMSKEVNG